MKMLNSSLIATTLAASFAVTAAVPLNAAPQATPLTAGIEMASYEQEAPPVKPAKPAVSRMTTGSIKARHSLSASHVAWCKSHHMTYRSADNTYATLWGSRRECTAPRG
jgi:hypothetical protein